MIDLDYLAAPPIRRACIRFGRRLRSLPGRAARWLLALPGRCVRLGARATDAARQFFLMFIRGDIATRLSFFLMGFGCIRRGRFLRGTVYLVSQIAFWVFFFEFGIPYIRKLPTLGTVAQGEVWNEEKGIFEYIKGDNSMLVLLYGTVSLLICLIFYFIYLASVRDSYRVQCDAAAGKRKETLREGLSSLSNENFHKTLLFFPTLSVMVFTVLPLIFMILLSFTNYDRFHMPPGNLFTWVGLENFRAIFGLSDTPLLGRTFGSILSWTLVWAFFATVSNYVLGMLLAILINKKGIRPKRLFRTIFVLTIAVPQFVSLMFMRNLLADHGLVNVFLQQIGLTDAPIRFLTDGTLAKITVLIVNMWVGIPYSMLITTGILLNIPQDLYEASRIDGASPVMQFWKITLPYVLFITTPYLITQFVGNINNFNVIWLLSGGGPMTGEFYQGGRTDLLITWLYRITTGEQNYKLASVIGIITFVISAAFSLIVYSRSLSAGREGDFQ